MLTELLAKQKKGIEILRVREKPLKMINRKLDVLVPNRTELSKTNMLKIINYIIISKTHQNVHKHCLFTDKYTINIKLC